MEASSDPLVRPALLSRSHSLWPLSLVVLLSVPNKYNYSLNTSLLHWTVDFRRARRICLDFLLLCSQRWSQHVISEGKTWLVESL